MGLKQETSLGIFVHDLLAIELLRFFTTLYMSVFGVVQVENIQVKFTAC